jgi:hypothetical protein
MTSEVQRAPLKTRDEYSREATGLRWHWSDVFYADARAKGYRYAARSYAPGYVDCEVSLAGFDSFDDRHGLPFVARWCDDQLDRLSVEAYVGSCPGDEQIMVAYLKDGSHWVVGFLKRLIGSSEVDDDEQSGAGDVG